MCIGYEEHKGGNRLSFETAQNCAMACTYVLLSIGMLVAGRRNLIAAFQLKNRISGLSQASRLFTTKMSHTDEGTAAGLLVKRQAAG
jgi:hypothetical protein